MKDFTTASFSPDAVRTRFSLALSAMYKKEVPLYGDLINIVNDVDDDVVRKQARPELAQRHRLERHGAIRLGTQHELRTIGRLFAIFGMHPVGYYDLSVVGFPLHATAFRPIATESLAKNPFRIFTTLLRSDLVSENVREFALKALAKRNLFTDRLLQLIDQAEVTNTLSESEIDELLVESLKIFKWHSVAIVSHEEYTRLLSEHPMVADIASFPSAHINHLTPRTLDIDQVQQIMIDGGLPAKERIEGPPPRKCEILLRQTSFKALEEEVRFYGADGSLVIGSHTARFGEVEQRGAAVTRKGRDLYDQLLSRARAEMSHNVSVAPNEILKATFKSYPDDWNELRKQTLTFNYYKPTIHGREKAGKGELSSTQLSQLIDDGLVQFEPITYEDFLPVSAAGIFTSNLRSASSEGLMKVGNADRAGFERDLGGPVADEFKLYETMQKESIEKCREVLGMGVISLE
ncbi:hypothetical protein G7Z17_g601 [Cylindrodendrum hubeiense]|uniref:2-oxoadipate dioxygenase/decarboxylase n=1 Tax=Cylindrodendrum hubeiense TaxID=595255 RepID=A0A9P5LD93_9HYPO|nr:hypothetical protein G7Z17_g601 [Cylindrodendrum hubeiense]